MKLKAIPLILLSILLFSVTAWAGLSKTEVCQLYVSIFGRASEGEGNAYWQSLELDMATTADVMLDTDVARNYFGANLNTNEAFIEHIYLNTLNKTIADDFRGISYWVNLLDTGTSRGEAVRTLVGAIKDYAPGGTYYDPDDAATVAAYNQFTNRVTVSDYMADSVYDTPDDWQTSTSFSHGLIVTDNAATVAEAKRAVDHFKFVPPTIELSKTLVDLETSESTTITISGGSGNFSVVNSNMQVASAWITGNNLGITGLSEGTITLFVTDAEGKSADVTVTVAPLIPHSVTCGAYVAPGVWKDFDCYNLAAIGKTTGADPFTPSWQLIGGYWQWGRKGPDPDQEDWYNTNTEHFAHGPTGPGVSEANDGPISGWSQTIAPNGAWSDASKTVNDPCPVGFRVPTITQWEGVINNNTQTTVGSWSISATNYSNARFFGNDLMLPAAGGKGYYDGSLCDYDGNYWSSTGHRGSSAEGISVYSTYADTGYNFRGYGVSLRCIADSDPFLSTGMYPAADGSGYSDFHEFKLDKGGYLDITKFKSTVGLYNQSLAVVNSDLASDDYIHAGEYKLKFTYQPTSLIPGNVTIFSLELIEYSDLPIIESKKYNAVGSFGSYSEYYKLDMGVGGYVDVTTTKAAVYVYNKTVFENDGMPLTSHYENIIGNTYLDGGEYIVKLTYSATSLTPGTVSFMAN